MPQRTNTFQQLIFHIEKAIASNSVTVTQSEMVLDRDGNPREVDIFIKGKVNKTEINIAIECRDHSRAQTIEWVEQLNGKYGEISNVNKVIAVSREGFSETAKEKAIKFGIECRTLDEALETDWPEKMWSLFVRFIRCELNTAGIRVEWDINAADKDAPPKITPETIVFDEKTGKRSTLSEEVQSLFKSDASPSVQRQINNDGRELFKDPQNKQIFYDVPYIVAGKFLEDGAGNKIKITNLTIKVKCDITFEETQNTRYTYNGTPILEGKSDSGQRLYLYPKEDASIENLEWTYFPGKGPTDSKKD